MNRIPGFKLAMPKREIIYIREITKHILTDSDVFHESDSRVGYA
jgi:hypothetical protein